MFGKPKPFGVEPLVQDFAEACANLHAAAFPHGWSSHEFERLIGAETSFGEAAVENRSRRLLGFVLSRRALDEAEILTVAVDAPMRGRGIGRKLLESHLPRLGRHGVKLVFLDVGENNVAALHLYGRLGFMEVGRRQAYYRAAGQPVSAIVMRRGIA